LGIPRCGDGERGTVYLGEFGPSFDKNRRGGRALSLTLISPLTVTGRCNCPLQQSWGTYQVYTSGLMVTLIEISTRVLNESM